MMKTLKTILITLFVTLSFVTCKKDEYGQWIQYYKNKTGVGYVFYKWDNDSIAPIPNLQMQIESHTGGSGGIFSFSTNHFDYVYTSDGGKYVFKLVKKIDGKDIASYFIYPQGVVWDEPISYSGSIDFYSNPSSDNPYIDNFNNAIIKLDTIFYFPNRTLY